MSSIISLRKQGGQPRFFVFLCALIAFWVAIPVIVEFSSNKASAQTGVVPGLTAQLTGSPIASVTPRGNASYFEAPAGAPEARLLVVNVSNINLPNGTVLSVALNSSAIGNITLQSNFPNSPSTMGGFGTLRLSTANGGTVPHVVAGDIVTVGPSSTAGSTTYLSGTFAAPPSPSPTSTHTPWPSPSHTPWPSPSQTASPSPTGTPMPARFFAARLRGANEVPPVTTNGLGFGIVGLNSAGTQIRVNVGVRGLSGPATAITINGPASTTENGPVIFTMTPSPANNLPFVSQTFDVTAAQVADLRAGLWYIQVATAANPTGEIRGQLNSLRPNAGGGPVGGGISDNGPDGSGSGDLRQAGSTILLQNETDDLPYPGDFDGDGIVDMAMFYPSIGAWYLNLSSNRATQIYRIDRPEHLFTTVF